jgi:YVTN family beta-propeller protein
MAFEIYTTDTDAGSITVIRSEEAGKYEVVEQIDVGNAPRGAVKFTRDGRGYVSNCGGNTISEIDVLTHREVARIRVGSAPRGIGLIPGDRHALVSNSGDNTLSVVDLHAREERARVAVGRDPRHMAVTADGQSAYVAIWGSHYVAKVDVAPLSEAGGFRPERVREIHRIAVGRGAHPYSVAIHPSKAIAYVANTQAEYSSVIDLATDRITAQVPLGSRGSRAVVFSPDGRYAMISIENTSEVAVIDIENHAVANRIAVGPGPRGIALDSRATWGEWILYATAFARTTGGDAVASLQRLPNTVTVANLRGGEALTSATFLPEYQEIAVGAGPCSVSVLDIETTWAAKMPVETAR